VTFLAPWYLLGAAAVAGATLVLHLLVTRLPPGMPWPTARFVPQGPAAVRRLHRRPVHPWVLLARLVAVLAVGAAFAGPVLAGGRSPRVRVVVADRSRAVGDSRAVIDSVRTLDGRGPVVPLAALVLLDDSSRVVTGPAITDSLERLRIGERRGRISAGLIAGIRAAARWRDRADSIELVVVSPLRADEIDAATDSIRARWPGAIRLVRVAPRADPAGAGATVRWPDDGHPPTAVARATVDTVGGLIAGSIVVIAPFVRRWALDAPGARVVARWVDGAPAAVERPVGRDGCVRDVAVALPTTGDVGVRPEVRRLVAALTATPCGAAIGAPAGGDPTTGMVGTSATAGTIRAAAARALEPASAASRSPLAAWLLAVGAASLLAESWLRRGAATPAT